MEWLTAILAELPADAHWSTRRRMAILQRWPLGRQAEAQADAAVGKPALRDQMIAEIEAIKAAIPSGLPPSVPEVVTMRQARLALLQTGMLTSVSSAVAVMPGDAGEAARIEWEFSSTVERNRPLVQSLIGALGLTEAQLDALFTLAATL